MPLSSSKPPFASFSLVRRIGHVAYPSAARQTLSAQRFLSGTATRQPRRGYHATLNATQQRVATHEADEATTVHAHSMLRQRALEVGLIASSDERSHARAPLSAGATHDSAAFTNATTHGKPTPVSSTSSDVPAVSQDPLLDFLEKNEEDAAALLAMWTSLTRACLYASEVSESLTLRVRYFLHRLIHQRATAAAWELYERLVYLGVQLRHSDIALLVRNLPYEHAAKDSGDIHAWMHEDAAALKDRKARARRQHEIAEEAARWRRKADEMHETSKTTQHPTPKPVTEVIAPCASQPREPRTSAQDTSVEPHVLANQPEWVKRWLLYEASMGNFNLYESADTQSPKPQPSSSTDAAAAAATVAALAADANQQIWEGVSTQRHDELRDHGQQAVRTLELTSRIEHLRILQLAPPQTQRTYRVLSRQSGAAPRRWRVRKAVASVPARAANSATAAMATELFWKDALDSTRNFYAAEKLSSMPAELRGALRAVVLGSRSWQAAMSYCHALASFGIALEAADAALFLHLSADSTPWKSSSKVEAFVDQSVWPALPSTGTVHAAAATFWLAHLCGVKSSRPEDFVALLDHAGRVFALPEAVVLQGDMAAVIQTMVDVALAGTRGLHVDIQSHQQRQRAAQALASSIRSGVFTVAAAPSAGGETHGDQAPAVSDTPQHVVRAESMGAVTALGFTDDKDALLSADLLATLRTLCMSTHDALWIAALAASPRQQASVVTLHQLLEECVYGPRSLWALYHRIYQPPTSDVGALAAVRAAPEGPYVSCVMARFLSQVLLVVCRQYSKTRAGFGASQTVTITSPTQVLMLLEMLESSLAQVQSRSVGDTHLAWSSPLAEERAWVTNAWPRVLRQLFTYLGLQSSASSSVATGGSCSSLSSPPSSLPDERLLFGAVTATTTECLARAGQLTLLVNELSQYESLPNSSSISVVSAAGNEGDSPQCDAWRAMPFRTRKCLRMCFDKQTTLGKKVRQHLNRKALVQMDSLLFPPQRRPSVKASFHYYSPPPRSLGTADAAASPDASTATAPTVRLDATAMASLMATRQHVHELVLRLGGNSAQLNSVLTGMLAKSDWAEALQLLHILTDDLRVAPRTLHPHFFQCVLAAMTRSAPAAPMSPAASSRLTESPRRVSSPAPATSAAGDGVRGALWLDAIGVFWKAVDHTTPSSAPSSSQPSAVHERRVFGDMLVPLIEFSEAVDRRDLGREWYGAWSRLYTRPEKRHPRFRERSAEALSLLGDAASLDQSVRLVRAEDGHSTSVSQSHEDPSTQTETDVEAAQHALAHYSDPLTESQLLLCRVAPRQRQWLKALDAVTSTFGSITAREAAQLPYPPPVVVSLLAVLHKSRTNLSNTGLRLHQLQRGDPATGVSEQTWDAACAIPLAEMLVKARRWKRASEIVNEALGLPSMEAIKSVEHMASAPPEHVREYATLLTLGLQAAAIGGLGDAASELYTNFQALEVAVCGCKPVVVADTPDGDDSSSDVIANASTPATATAVVDGGAADEHALVLVRSHIEGLAPRARSFYFRAMTKKMFPKGGDRTPHEAE